MPRPRSVRAGVPGPTRGRAAPRRCGPGRRSRPAGPERPPGRAGRCAGAPRRPTRRGRGRPRRRRAAPRSPSPMPRRGRGAARWWPPAPWPRATGRTSHCPGAACSDEGLERGELVRRVVHEFGKAVDHGAAVVDRVVEDRSCQHQAVDQGHRHADRRRCLGRAQRPAGGRPVDHEVVAGAAIGRRDDHGPAVDHHAQVAHEPGVEHGVEVLASVRPLVGEAPEPDPVARRIRGRVAAVVAVCHGTIVARRSTRTPGPDRDRDHRCREHQIPTRGSAAPRGASPREADRIIHRRGRSPHRPGVRPGHGWPGRRGRPGHGQGRRPRRRDVRRRIRRAWRDTSLSARSRILFAFRELADGTGTSSAALITAEHGKVLAPTPAGEVARGHRGRRVRLRHPAPAEGRVHARTSRPASTPHSIRQPLGVVAGITPFNFPVMVPMWMFPVAIACGNTFVLKPSEKDPSAVAGRSPTCGARPGCPTACSTSCRATREAVDALLDHPTVAAVSLRRVDPDRAARLRDGHAARQAGPGPRRREEPHGRAARRRPRPTPPTPLSTPATARPASAAWPSRCVVAVGRSPTRWSSHRRADPRR